MLSPPRALRVLGCLLALALFLPSHSSRASAQSSADGELLLRVASVTYLLDKGKIEYKLENDGQGAVTAYVVEISAVIRGKYDAWSRGPISQRHDLLTLELDQQCWNAGANPNDDDDAWPHLPKIPPGVIQPGKERMESTDASLLLPDYLLPDATIEVSAHVTGVIWSDRRIEGTTGVPDMQRIRDDWLEAAREERDVLAVLRAHKDDGDYQHRVNVTIEDLQSLMKGYPREVPVPEDEPPPQTMYVWEPGVVSGTIRELDYAAYRADPVARITSYIEFLECAHERRIELQEPAMAGRPHR